MDMHVDAVVMGSGSAGTSAAMALRKAGRSVVLVDERPFGGTCALRGCDPKKVLVAAAGAVENMQRYRALGVFEDIPPLQWPMLMRFKRTFTDPVPHEREKQYADAGVMAMHGRARFVDQSTILVNEQRVRAGHVVIATGAAPAHVADGDEHLLTSEDFLDLERLPESLVFVGGGYIAFEFAHIAARAGARITVLNNDDTPLGGFDQDVVARLLQATQRVGIDVVLNARVQRVERSGDGVAVHARTSEGDRTFRAAHGVLSAGRVPNLDALDLTAAGVERTKKGVKVDQHLQSVSNPLVYAAGDCADGGGLPLTPVAGSEGETAAANILHGNTQSTDFRGLPSMVYAIPALGQVGMTEQQAREAGIDIAVHAGDMSQWYSTRHLGADAAYYKVVLEKASGMIVGATILGPQAEQQINVLALAIRRQIPASEVASALFAYPTGASDLPYLL